MSAHVHDAFFKRVFSRPELAADLIRRNLPPGAADALDLERLQRLDGEFIDERLGNRRADLVFRAPLREARGREAVIPFFLIEHRSTPWPLAPLDALGYALPLWRGFVERARAESGRTPRHLPLLIPIVVYQGTHRWRGPRDLVELFDLPPGLEPVLGPYLPRFPLLVDDLAVHDPEEGTSLALTAVALLTMRFVRDESDPAGFKRRWQALVDAAAGEPHTLPIVEASAQYLYDASDRLGPEDIVEAAMALRDPEAKEKLMTLGEKMKALGREEGLQQGLQQGRQEGLELGQQRGQVKVLLNLIQLKFGAPDPAIVQRIGDASTEELDLWSARILTAATLSELLGDAG